MPTSTVPNKRFPATPAPVPRLIPGTLARSLPRAKPPQSVRFGGDGASAAAASHVPARNPWEHARALPTTLFPQPQVSDRWALYSMVCADFLLTAAIFISVHILWFDSVSILPLALPHLWNLALKDQHLYICAAHALVYGALVTLLGYTEGLYDENSVSLPQKMTPLLRAIGWATILTGADVQFSRPNPSSWYRLICAGTFSFAGLLGWRACRLHLLARRTSQGKGVRNILIIGRGKPGLQLAGYFENHPEARCTVKGFLDDRWYSSPDVLGSIDDLSAVARAQFIDEVILSDFHDRNQAQRVIQTARLNRLDLRIVADLFGSSPQSFRVECIGDVPLISVAHEPLPVVGLLFKRMIDIVLSGASLLLLAPLMALVAATVKLDSPGPVIYSALRVGKKGSRFRCHKFRSMTADANAQKDSLRKANQRRGPCFKIAADPRITRAGRFLRRYSLDELPQLWNVLKGEMSLVGPRPHPVDDFERYQLDHLRRLDVTPGITGLWQVTARQNPSFQTNLRLDLEYIERWSLWLDLRILFKTCAVVFNGSGV